MRLLETVAADGVLVEALLTAKSETPIGIICMYSAQKARLEEVFSRRPWDVRFLGTVRRFLPRQGEYDRDRLARPQQ